MCLNKVAVDNVRLCGVMLNGQEWFETMKAHNAFQIFLFPFQCFTTMYSNGLFCMVILCVSIDTVTITCALMRGHLASAKK